MRARAILLATLVSATAFAACGGSSSGSGGYVQPTGPSLASIEVDAGNLFFKPAKIEAPEGVVKIWLKNIESGSHNLVITGSPGFILEVNGDGDAQAKKVELKAGSFDYYCTLPGHRAGGMQGTLIVK
jgi:plastocyanin